jgi:hypothetical protein
MSGIVEWIIWNLWERWLLKWKHRNDTQAQTLAALKESWGNVISDTPATRELHEANDAMERIFKLVEERKHGE